MDTYQTLRQQARAKRDSSIKNARAEYQRTLHAIGALKRTLGGEVEAEKLLKGKSNREKGAAVDALVRKLAPTGREFTVAELIELVGAETHWPIFDSTIRGVLRRLMDQGVVRKVRRDFQGEMIWERVGDGAEPETPFESLALPDAIAIVLAERGPLRVPEITVALQDRGYRVDAQPKQLQDSVRAAVTRCGERFKVAGERRWGVCARNPGNNESDMSSMHP